MIRCNTFVRSALFAAAAAAGWFPWFLAVAPFIGVWNARALYLIVTAALYTAGLPARETSRLPVFAVVVLAGSGLAFATRTTTELCVGLAVILGLARSGFLYRTTPARAVMLEALLLIGGLCFARFLGGPSLASTGLALWGFLLVQSLFFLVAAIRPRPAAEACTDAFEEAHRRAEALLERSGV
jgi:hypothetical protein